MGGFVSASEHGVKASVRDSLVKIYTVKHQADYYNPWRMLNMANISGSGVIIDGHMILTNAHVVADHKYIQVRRHGEAKRHNAKVKWISHAADLAILTTENKEFFKGVTPLSFGPLPQSQKEAIVYGFPIGGDSLSITKGILSRIEHQIYSHSSNYFLAGQLDAAINPGNSGGPVLVDGKIVGVVMQNHRPNTSENIGYMVPVPIVRHFLDDVADGKYDGFPDIAIVTQHMENPAIKRKYGVPDKLTGVLVNHIGVGSVAAGKLFPNDVILAVDGHTIADNGSVEFRPGERTSFGHFIDIHQIGEMVNLKVFRDGKTKNISLHLTNNGLESILVPQEQYSVRPRFFIFGGLVLSQLTKNVVTRWGKNWKSNAPRELIIQMSNWPTAEKREIVVILQTLPADVNVGYHDQGIRIVEKINGQKIKSLAAAHKIIKDSKDEFVVFTLDHAQKVVINRKEAELSHRNILDNYNISHDCSADLKSIPAP